MQPTPIPAPAVEAAKKGPVDWFLGIDPEHWPWLAAIIAGIAVIVVVVKIEAFLKATSAVGGLLGLFRKEVSTGKKPKSDGDQVTSMSQLRTTEGSFFKTVQQVITFTDTVRVSAAQEEMLLRLFQIHLAVLKRRPSAQKRFVLDLALVDKHNSGLVRVIISLIEVASNKYADIELHILLATEPVASLATAADVWKGQIKAIEAKKGEGYASIVSIVHK